MCVEKCKVNLCRPTVFKGNIVGLIVERNKEGNFLFKWWAAIAGRIVGNFLNSGNVCTVQSSIQRKMLPNNYRSDC
jgi:hypothetical protein